MPIFVGTLARYFGLRFLTAVLLVFAGIFALVTLVDYIELMRRAGDIPNVSAVLVAKTSFYRVPQVVERILPFCILIGAMSCYLGLSRRLELVVARSAGLSAWQFVTPALVVAFVLGLMATAIYNPLSAILQERSKRFETELFGHVATGLSRSGGTFWIGQRTDEGQAIINAVSSRDQGSISTACLFSLSTPKANSSNALRHGRPYWSLASGCSAMPASMRWPCCR